MALDSSPNARECPTTSSDIQSMSRVILKQERLIVVDQELIEREATRKIAWRNRGADPVDSVGDLVDSRARVRVRDSHSGTLTWHPNNFAEEHIGRQP